MSKSLSLAKPIWQDNIIRDESLTFVYDDGGVASAPLLFEPKIILSITDSHGSFRYKEGTDYTVEGSNIVLCKGTKIFAFTKDELYPKVGEPGHCFPMENGNVYFSEGTFFHDRQVKVTYIAKECNLDIEVPHALGKLPRLAGLLSRHKDINMCVLGDSISIGANASGFRDVNAVPYNMPYASLFCTCLAEKYVCKINFTNLSVGGKDSAWGVETAPMAAQTEPDLCILAFGANDRPSDPVVCKDNYSKMINIIRESNPECEFIVIASSVPNPLLTGENGFVGRIPEFRYALKELEGRRGVVMADITTLQEKITGKKRYIDLTANNVNHPNDFFHRLYAQYLISMF